MKGKLLTVDDILELDDKYVYIEPPKDYFYDNKGKAKINITEENIYVYPENGTIGPWVTNINNPAFGKDYWLTAYEWIEESKTYKGWEILKMIDEGKLEENTILVSCGKSAGTLEMFLNGGIELMKSNEPFVIFKEKEYMTFIEAIKTDAKFKYKTWDNYDTLEEAIYDLSNLSNEQIGEMIKEKAWEVQ